MSVETHMATCAAPECDEEGFLSATVVMLETPLFVWPPTGMDGELHFAWCPRHSDMLAVGLMEVLAAQGERRG